MSGVQAANPFGVSFGAGSIQRLIDKKDKQADSLATGTEGNAPSLNGGAQGASLTVVG